MNREELLGKIVNTVSGVLETASVNKVETASNLSTEQKIEGLIRNFCFEKASNGKKTFNVKRAEEIASIIVEDVTIWLESDKSLSDIAEVRNIKMGDTRKVSLDYEFTASTVHADGSGFYQTPMTKTYNIETMILDVSANISIFRLIQGQDTIDGIYEKMRRAMINKQLSLVLGTIITAVGTSGDYYKTFTDSAGLKTGLVSVKNSLEQNGINVKAILGYKTVTGQIAEISGYSDKFLEDRDKGILGTFRGIPIWGMVKPVDRDGNAIFASSFDDCLVLVGEMGVYVAIESTAHQYDDYDLVQKQHMFNLFQEFGALAISGRNGLVKDAS